MSLIKFKKIVSCSSEDKVHSSKNLLKFDQTKNWLSSKETDERIICILEFEKSSVISSIDIGNNGSTSIELLVSPALKNDWTVLLPSTNLLDPNEIKSFISDDLNKKWKRLKIICEQDSDDINQFGLNFIKLYSNLNADDQLLIKTKKRKLKDKDESVVTPKVVKKRNHIKKKLLLENEEKLKVGEIPDFFHDNHFYVSYGDYDDNTLVDIIRVIFAYDGILERQINSDVKYVITNRMWNQDFEKISKANPDIKFVNLDWLQDCHDTNQFVAVDPYLIVC